MSKHIDSARSDTQAAATGGWSVRWRMLLKDTLVYGLSGALGRMVSLLTFPILTRFLSTENYGRVDFLLVAASLGAMVLMMGQDSAVARLYYDGRPEEERARIITQALGIQALAVLMVVVPAVALVAFMPGLTEAERDFRAACLLQLCNLPLIVLTGFGANILRWTFRRGEYIGVTLGGAVLGGGGMLTGLWVGGGAMTGVFAGLLLGNLVTAGVALGRVRVWLRWPAGRDYVRELLRLGLPYMGIAVLGAWLATLERTLVLGLGTEEMLGQYAAGARVASIAMLPIGAFQAAWTPLSLAIHRQADAAATYSRVLLVACGALVGLSVLSHWLAGPIVGLLAGNRYLDGAVVVGPLMFGLAIRALGWVGGIGLDLAKQPQWVIPAQLCGSLLAVVLAILWPNPHLIARVAWGVCIGQLVSAAMICYFGHRRYPQQIGYLRPALLTGVGLGVIAFLPAL